MNGLRRTIYFPPNAKRRGHDVNIIGQRGVNALDTEL